MTSQHDQENLPDTDLITLFAGVQPAAGFEDRLITAVRRQPRLRLVIPLAVRKSAIAAAAVLAVGSIGYLGSQAMNGQLRSARDIVNRDRSAANLHQMGLAITEIGQKPQFADPEVVDKFSTHSGWWGWPDYTTDGRNKEALAASDFGFKQNPSGEPGQSQASGAGKQNLALGLTGGLGVEGNFDIPRMESKQWGPATKAPQPFVSGGSITKGSSGTSPYEKLDSILLPSSGQGGDGIADTTFPPTVKNYMPGSNGQPLDPGTQANSGDGKTHITGFRYDTGTDTAGANTGKAEGLNSYPANKNNQMSLGATIPMGSIAGQQPGGQQALGITPLITYGSQIGSANVKAPQDRQSGEQRPTTPLAKPTYFAAAGPDGDFSMGNDRLYQSKGKAPQITSGTLQLPTIDLPALSDQNKDATIDDGTGAAGSYYLSGHINRAHAEPFGQQAGGQQPATTPPGNTTFVDANGKPAAPGSIAANPADYPVAQAQGQMDAVHKDAEQLGVPPQKITTKQAVIAAGGPDAEIIPQRTEIIRRIGTDNTSVALTADESARKGMAVDPKGIDLRDVLAGANQIALKQNDHVLQPVPPATAPVIDDRKIIRTGTMEFDVDRFDTAQMQITKIVLELGGFVGATDSQKLPNGKVRGSIAVRVPPERLDVLVLSLRALGDLKSQQITAADITKEYTDVQSELAADRAMQDRLLELIHDGKGSVKDLLAAENELGEWRTKIEKAEGMIRYYNGQVALSTLTITLTERDIQTPATAVETETADVGIEAEDVEKARNSALKAIDDVKGRIVEAELKRFDAGQLAARLVADVPPESAGAVIDQLKQLGKVARLEIHRQETNSNGKEGEATGAAPLHTERKPTRLLISIYNLANVAPRRTTNVSLAAADVEAAYTALVAATKSSGGRVVTSNLDRGDPNKATGALVLEFPPEKFDAAMATLHAQGEVLNLSSTENPDTQNSTEAKQGLTVKLIALANVAPRHTTNVALAAGDVNAAYAALIGITKSSGGRVVTSNLEQGDPLKANGSLVLELPPEKFDAALTTLHAQGDVLKFNLMENADTQNSTEAKQGLTVRLVALAAIAPREIVQQTLAAPDVPTAYQAILSAASSTKSRVQSASLNEQDRQNITADIQVEVPRAEIADFDKGLNAAGGTIARTSGRSADAENTVDSKVQVKLSVISADHLAPRETTKLQVEVSDVDKCANDAQAAAIAAGGRVVESTISKDHGKGIARIILDFPLDKSADLLNQIRSQGTVRGIDASRDQQAPTGPLAHGQIYVEFRTTEAIVADQTGPWASVRSGLSTSVNGLLWSLQWVVVGLCLIGPWALVGWVGWKFWKRRRPATP